MANKLTKEELEDIQIANTLRVLLQTEGWHHLSSILKLRMKEKQDDVLRPFLVAKASNPTLSKEDYQEICAENKGALFALRLILDTPKAIIDNADDILARLPPEARHTVGDDE